MKLIVTRKITSRNANNLSNINDLPSISVGVGSDLVYKFIPDKDVTAYVASAIQAGKVAHVFDYADTFVAQTTVASVRAA